jgi:hypothetical protein
MPIHVRDRDLAAHVAAVLAHTEALIAASRLAIAQGEPVCDRQTANLSAMNDCLNRSAAACRRPSERHFQTSGVWLADTGR